MGLREKIKAQRERRKRSIRIKIEGSSERPRLTVYKSLKYVSAQIIDDSKGITLVSASSQEKDLKSGKNADIAKEIGKILAARAKEKNISEVVFDRNGYIYHGKIKSLADGAREAGLKF
ncbi:50S ribosomal protein L18 [Brachyspira murdochii]|uniref:Large ribosomal subunit protein uL18 n=1 Tax=Brachyspira murdochii (strain ATCC 51284 / DSM 12563 / 56-150) TaxID=526224 RepID=D5UB61_BRAM5|nr:50S ribosomal protein L18 [Brachyspira murdochii]ADG71934.1 ribosomal protein L18 [Brachyspira murdochii DSM 12563]